MSPMSDSSIKALLEQCTRFPLSSAFSWRVPFPALFMPDTQQGARRLASENLVGLSADVRGSGLVGIG